MVLPLSVKVYFHFMSDEEIEGTGVNFTYDDHGHPELGNVSKAHIFNMLVQRKLKKLNISVKSRPNEIGYELALRKTHCL